VGEAAIREFSGRPLKKRKFEKAKIPERNQVPLVADLAISLHAFVSLQICHELRAKYFCVRLMH
jgi:hypothetical protein